MTNPLVSFIIPYYNAGNTIQETVDSIFNQSYPHFDVWIVNDGSTDPRSIEKLKDFEGNKRIQILHQENAGPSVARNKAISQSMAEFIVPIDADDVMGSRILDEAIPHMKENQNVGVVYGDLQYFGDSHEKRMQEAFSLERQWIMNQVAVTALIRKDVFIECGGYDEHLSPLGLEDWEFWIRVGLSAWEFKKIPHLFFKARSHANSRTFQAANANMEQIKEYVYQKHMESFVKSYDALYYQKKQLLETPDYRIGNFILRPYRWMKRVFFHK
jgi:glycosyltransferase involved in cell wall biosynthesis